MSYIDQNILEPVRARLRNNAQARRIWGALEQDFSCQQGEVFYGNLTVAQFEELPLRTKRKAGPARCTRLFSKVVGAETHVSIHTYADRYKDRQYAEVYVHTYELEMLGVEY